METYKAHKSITVIMVLNTSNNIHMYNNQNWNIHVGMLKAKMKSRIQYTVEKYKKYPNPLKTLDTIGNCQRPVFSLGVSQQVHKLINKPVKIWAQLVVKVAR